MKPWTNEEMSQAISELSPMAQLELERNLFRLRAQSEEVTDDGVRNESGVESEATEA